MVTFFEEVKKVMPVLFFYRFRVVTKPVTKPVTNIAFWVVTMNKWVVTMNKWVVIYLQFVNLAGWLASHTVEEHTPAILHTFRLLSWQVDRDWERVENKDAVLAELDNRGLLPARLAEIVQEFGGTVISWAV